MISTVQNNISSYSLREDFGQHRMEHFLTSRSPYNGVTFPVFPAFYGDYHYDNQHSRQMFFNREDDFNPAVPSEVGAKSAHGLSNVPHSDDRFATDEECLRAHPGKLFSD